MSTENSLLQQLQQNKKWPLRYMFKFIAPNNTTTIAAIKKRLPKSEQTSIKFSKNAKYAAITCIAYMKSAEEIVNVTADINKIEGVMTL